MVDQPDEAEPLGERDELARRDEHPVGAFEAEKRLVEARSCASGVSTTGWKASRSRCSLSAATSSLESAALPRRSFLPLGEWV